MRLRAESRELRAALVLAGFVFGGIATAAENRLPPSRPASEMEGRAPARPPALPTTRIDNIEYVSAADIARRLDLKGVWTNLRKNYTLSARNTKIEFEADGRKAWVNNLWIHLGNPTVVRRGQLYVSRTDYERSILPRANPGLIPTRPPRPLIIAIDAGHGGPDDGSLNQKLKLKEADLTLDMAKRLQAIALSGGFRVVMTRTTDEVGRGKPEWDRRANVVNRAGADLLVSIHLNALADTKTGGTETIVFTPVGQASTQEWETKNPQPDPDPATVNKHDAWSAVLSQSIQRELLAALKTRDRGQKTMHSAILRNMDCPAVLVESAFITSDAEGQNLAKPEYRQKIAEAIFAGIKAYAVAVGP